MSLLDDASLIVTPNAEKAGKLYSIIPSNGNGDFSVTRATTATRTNASGLIESTPINEPRLDYSLGSCPNILLEPQRTNVVLHSADLSQSVWSKTNYSLASTTAIQGLNTTRITKNAVNNGFYAATGGRNVTNTIGTFAAGTKTLTYLIRKGNTDKVGFIINNVLVGALTSVACEFNFNTQTFTNVSLGLTTSFESPSANVYRISLTINDIGIGSSKAIWIAPIDASNNTIDGGYLDFAFAQWEAGAYATSYIPTTSASVTRNADVISKTGIADLIGQTEGTIFIETRPLQSLISDGVTRSLFSLNQDFLSLNLFYLRRIDNAYLLNVNSSGTSVANPTVFTYSNINLNKLKIAIKYGLNTLKVFVNGVNTVNQTISSVPTTNTLTLGSNRLSGDILEGRIDSFQLYKTALTDTQCIALTTL